MKWSTPGKKTKRCRLDCGNGFFIIEDPLKNGFSYRLEYRDSTGKRNWIRMDKSRIRNKDSAYEESLRLRLEIANETLSETCSDVKKFSEGIDLYLRDKKTDRLRCYSAIERTMRNRLEPFFGEMRLRDISLQDVKDYRDTRKETVGDDAILRETVWLKEYFNLMIERGFMDKNPVNRKKLKLNLSKRNRFMSNEEEKLIWPLLRKYPAMLNVADFALHTSMRPSNILSLHWDRILWEDQKAVVPGELHKQKKDGHYLLDGEILEMLKRLQELNSQNGCSPFVFTRYKNGKSKPIKLKWIQATWNQITQEAGVENLHFYDLKTTCLSRIAAIGANVFQLKAISNHSSTSSLERYVSEGALEEEALRLMEKRNQVWDNNGVKNGVRKEPPPRGRELN